MPSNFILMAYFFWSHFDFRNMILLSDVLFTSWVTLSEILTKLSYLGRLSTSVGFQSFSISKLLGAEPELYTQTCVAGVGKLLDYIISKVSPKTVSLRFSICVNILTQSSIITQHYLTDEYI